MSTKQIGKTIKCIDKLILRNVNQMTNKEYTNDLSPMQFWVIGYLYFNGDKTIYQKDLEIEFGVPKSTLATMLKGLVEKGYIMREPAEHDTRLKQILLTEKAKNLQLDHIRSFHRIDDVLCEDISEEDIEHFMRVISKMKKNLEKRLNE